MGGGRGLGFYSQLCRVSMGRSPLRVSVSLFVKKREELNQSSSSLGQGHLGKLGKDTVA